MQDNILIIAQGSGFMTNALTANLKKAGFSSLTILPDIPAIGGNIGDTAPIILYAGDFVFEKPDVLVYIKDLCAERTKPLFLVGYENELAEIKKTVPAHLITREFTRPFDMKELTETISKINASGEKRSENKHILLVDDDPTFLNIMSDMLSVKYGVTPVRSGMQAIKYLASYKPDLILLDHDMPITSGPQVMEMIRSDSDPAEIPIIFLTGKADRESVMKVMQLKPQGYLLKSESKDKILENIGNFFETNRFKTLI